MALVTPSRVTITDVNTELNIAASARTRIANTWVHNVAAIPTVLISTNTLNATTLGAVQSITAPDDANFAIAKLWGGGGGSSSLSTFGGGGGGGFNLKRLDVNGGSTVISCVVGLRGQAGTTGTTGGTTTVTVNSVTYSATGGTGGTSTTVGVGGSGSNNGDDFQVGGNGTSGTRPTRGGNAAGQSFGGGLGGLGAAGQTPGGGGGTSTTAANPGGDGRVIIDWYKSNTIRFSNLRWGINFPGRFHALSISRSNYANSNNIAISVITGVTGVNPLQSNFITANGVIDIRSDGILSYISRANASIGTPITNSFNRTWLTSGSNSDYTANVVVTSGFFDASPASDNTNQDLSLSVNRRWRKSVTRRQPPEGQGTTIQSVGGVIIIKNDGVEIFRRPFAIGVSASISFN